MIRAVIGARVSVVKGDEKVSHLDQHETGQAYAVGKGWEVVGAFEDLDVSASVSPFERPDLGPWLDLDRRGREWDAMSFAKVDRAFRSIMDCLYVVQWFKQNRRILVFTDDNLYLDYRTDDPSDFGKQMAEIFLMLAAKFAEIELNRIRTRSKNTHRYLKDKPRWHGGRPPYGYDTVEAPGGGRTLAVNPYQAAVVLWMALAFIGGMSFSKIAEKLNDPNEATPYKEKIPTNHGTTFKGRGRKQAAQKAADPTLYVWGTNTVARLLRSWQIKGYKTSREKPVLDKEGNPIKLAPGLLPPDVQKDLEKALHDRKRTGRQNWGEEEVSKLLGIITCGIHGQPAYERAHTSAWNGKRHTYYRCASYKIRPACNSTVRGPDGETLVHETFLREVGHRNVPIRTYIEGEDHSEDLEEVQRLIRGLRDEKDEGFIIGEQDELDWKRRMRALLARREALAALPSRPAGWAYEDSGETYATVWAREDDAGKRKLIQDSGIKLAIWGKVSESQWMLSIPGDVLGELKGEALKTVRIMRSDGSEQTVKLPDAQAA
ncbi:recombinase family protein [Streptomyces sp. NPDC059708]|uniref:recombinase family protein n=1 Tax=Streptomyces sp. NPDC059708 TaxID=3346916 RepID=UPI0036C9D39F